MIIIETRIAAVESTKVFGKTCLVGEGGEVTYQPTPHIIHKHLTILGSWTFSTFGLEEAAKFTSERNIPLDSVITSRSNIEEAPKAYKEFSKGARLLSINIDIELFDSSFEDNLFNLRTSIEKKSKDTLFLKTILIENKNNLIQATAIWSKDI